jgi:diketogulonate reductase-like aldo/keto reductase
MKYAALYDGKRIPLLGQGTWGFGGTLSADTTRDKEAVEAIRTAIDLGYTHLDTAEMYGKGHTEELVGAAIKGYDRLDLFISSKVWHVTMRYEDTLAALEGSLRRLGTEYLDLYMIHRPNHDIPLDETFRAMNQVVEQGKVRYLGVSNFNLEQMKLAQSFSQTPLVTNQVQYHLHNRQYAKNGVLDHCRQSGMLLTAYSPFDRGHLVKDATVQRIAEKCGYTPAQLALYWLIVQPGVIALPMSTRREHLEENLGALEIELSQEDLQVLNDIELPEEALWPE